MKDKKRKELASQTLVMISRNRAVVQQPQQAANSINSQNKVQKPIGA